MTSERLNRYLSAWNLSTPHLIAETPRSLVSRVSAADGITCILKLLTPEGDEERIGAIALRHYDGHGAVRLLRADDEAHLLEYADGDDLVPLVESGQDAEAVRIFADVVNRLHAVPCQTPPPGLISLKRRYRSLFQTADMHRQNHTSKQSIFIRAADHAEILLADERESRVLHGDIHHANIRRSSKRGWLAIDPKGLYGERTFDVANTFCNPYMPDVVHNETRIVRNAAILAEQMQIEPSRILSFAFTYACLSAGWEPVGSDVHAFTLRVAELIEPYVKLP